MGRKNKVFGLKGQKEMIDSLNGLFANFVNRETQAVIDKGLELGRYAGNGFGSPEEVDDPLGELLRDGARFLIGSAIKCELEEFLGQFEDRHLEDGRAAVVRNGYHPQREVQTGIGSVTVQIPKVRSRDGCAVAFRSALVPPYVRKTATLEAALPWLYLKGAFHRGDGSGAGSACGARGQGAVASYGVAAQAQVGRAVRYLAEEGSWRMQVGLRVGRRHIQQHKGRQSPVVRARDNRGERTGRKAFSSHRRRDQGIEAELARGVDGTAGAWDEQTPEACHRGRGAWVLARA